MKKEEVKKKDFRERGSRYYYYSKKNKELVY